MVQNLRSLWFQDLIFWRFWLSDVGLFCLGHLWLASSVRFPSSRFPTFNLCIGSERISEEDESVKFVCVRRDIWFTKTSLHWFSLNYDRKLEFTIKQKSCFDSSRVVTWFPFSFSGWSAGIDKFSSSLTTSGWKKSGENISVRKSEKHLKMI